MINSNPQSALSRSLSRRKFLQAGALAAGAVAAGACSIGSPLAKSLSRSGGAASGKKPNILFIMADQLGIDALSAYGCSDVHTPNMDRLARRSVNFMESYSSNPLCSPARSSMITGRMPIETGVTENIRGIDAHIPNMGQWFGENGYEAIYTGKWHLPFLAPLELPGFTVLPVAQGQADHMDAAVSRNTQAYLASRSKAKPFFLIASLSQPHDICSYAGMFGKRLPIMCPPELPFPEIKDKLPALPANYASRPLAPKQLINRDLGNLSEEQWRYYNYVYFRQVEMLDADIGRILDALEASGEQDNTVIVFTSDHGESRGRHGRTAKWTPYEESAKVPLMVSWPGSMVENIRDHAHLVSTIDIMPTVCDLAGIGAPRLTHARSLRPILQGKTAEWRDAVMIETQHTGRTIRTAQYKYVDYSDDPVKQLFDMKADPLETKNLYGEAQYDAVVTDHVKRMHDWEAQLEVSPQVRKG